MKKTILFFSALLILVLVGCTEQDTFVTDAPSIKHTYLIKALVPGENNEQQSRIALSQKEGSRDIQLRWEEGDKIHLYAVYQNKVYTLNTVELTNENIVEEGKRALFDPVFPNELTGKVFDLYGSTVELKVSADGSQLLQNLMPTPQFFLLNEYKKIPIFFKSKDMQEDKEVSVQFKHSGVLLCMNLKNNSDTRQDLAFLLETESNWYYTAKNISGNSAEIPYYDVVSEQYLYMQGEIPETEHIPIPILRREEKQYAFWLVPQKGVNKTSDIKVRYDETVTEDKIPARNQLKIGNAYHFYTTWVGGALKIHDMSAISGNLSDGVWILNEGNMTTENGSLIFIDNNGGIIDNVYSRINNKELGNVTQDLFIKDGKMWIISQNGKKSAVGTTYDNEGMLVLANAETLEKIHAFDDELKDSDGKYLLDWPTHIAVLNDQNIFIRDNNGVHRFNSTNNNLTLIKGTENAAKNRMAVADGKVFVIARNNILVLEANSSTVSQTIPMGAAISGVLKAKDGNVWVSTTGNPHKISKIDSKTYSVIKENEITVGKLGAGWGATPGITAKGDTLYYSNAGTVIYRHIFSTGESKQMVDAKSLVQNANMVYNNIAVHPITGDVYMNTIKGYGWDFLINNISVFSFNDNSEASLKANYQNYTHFPAGIFFTADYK